MTTNAPISTLSEFLLQAQTQHTIFDLGRGIRKLDNQTFFEWENQQSPCAFPRQDHAWFCIVFWNSKLSEERYIWFIKLPLDETGVIISAALNQFLDIIVQALGKNLEHTENSQAQLPENPFVFVPNQQQLAICNAHIRKSLNMKVLKSAASTKEEITPALPYLHAPNTIKNKQLWETLSLQDIADFVVQPNVSELVNKDVQELIINNLSVYAPPVLISLFASLESVETSRTLTKALINFHQTSMDANLATLCLRAMSFAPNDLSIDYLTQLINVSAGTFVKRQNKTDVPTQSIDVDTSIVIAARYWNLLTDEQLLSNFMHNVAIIDPSHRLFSGLYADLVKIPNLRNTMLRFIRQPKRSQEVSHAIGALFASTT